jgi:hypothetical protein
MDVAIIGKGSKLPKTSRSIRARRNRLKRKRMARKR